MTRRHAPDLGPRGEDTTPLPPPKVYQQKSTGPSPAFSVRNQVECWALQQPGLLPGLTLKTTGHRWPVWPGSAETLRPLRSWCLCRKVVLLESLWLGWLTTRGLHLRCVPIGHALRFLGLILTSSQLSPTYKTGWTLSSPWDYPNTTTVVLRAQLTSLIAHPKHVITAGSASSTFYPARRRKALERQDKGPRKPRQMPLGHHSGRTNFVAHLTVLRFRDRSAPLSAHRSIKIAMPPTRPRGRI